MIRGLEVALDRDIARMCGVQTRRINQLVKRNPARFPPEFCFRLTGVESVKLMSQIVINREKSRPIALENRTSQNVTSVYRNTPADREKNKKAPPDDELWRDIAQSMRGNRSGRYNYSENLGGIRKPPMVYTKQGAFMLSTLMRHGIMAEASIETIESHIR